MRTLAIGIIALLACGCASTAMFDLVPHEVGVAWVADQPRVRGESRTATIEASFDGIWRDWLVFDVTVVNQSDSVLRIEPTQFSYWLSSSRERLPAKLSRPFPAIVPERVSAQLDQGMSRESILWGTLLGMEALVAVADLVSDIAVDSQRTPEERETDEWFHRGWAELGRCTMETGRRRREILVGAREDWVRSALRRTMLPPGQSISGIVALPAWPLRQVVGPEPVEDRRSITVTPARRLEGYRLTLQAPPDAGGLQIQYDVRGR